MSRVTNELGKLYQWVEDNFKEHIFVNDNLNETLRESVLKSVMPFYIEVGMASRFTAPDIADKAIQLFLQEEPKEVTRWGYR